MKSGLNISATRLETVRQRRMNRIRRQRAIEVGKPVDVSLKTMALSSAQHREFTDFQFRPHVDRKHGIVTPKRVSVMAALGLHLIAVLLATYFIVSPTRLDAEATIIEIVHSIPTHPRRAPQPIHDFGDDNHLLDDRLKPNPSPWGFDDRIRNIGPTRPDAFVTLEIARMAIFSKRIEPIYPSEAKRAGKEGKVVLEATEDIVAPRITVPYNFKAEDSSKNFGWEGCVITPPDYPVEYLEGTKPPSWLKKIEPEYPIEAKHARKEGKVVLTAIIDLDGKAKDIKVKDDDVGFGCARAAIDALEASLFTPAKWGVEIVRFRVAVPYQFKLED